MTTSTSTRADAPHASDGELLALLDGEREPTLVLPRQHVESCDRCRARFEALRSYDGHVADSLAAIPVPAISKEQFLQRVSSRGRGQARWRRPAWRAAAAIVVLAGAAAAASPVRQWIRARLVGPPRVEMPALPAAKNRSDTPAPNSSGTTVAFAPAGPSFTIRFDSVPAAGMLTAERVSDAQIAVRAVARDGAASDALVVLPGELRVRNRSSSRAAYTLSVPAGVDRVRVIVAGRVVYDGAPPATVRLTGSEPLALGLARGAADRADARPHREKEHDEPGNLQHTRE